MSLGHRESGANFAVKQGDKPLLLLLRRPILGQNLCSTNALTHSRGCAVPHTHVSRVRGGAVDYLGRHVPGAAQEFCHDGVLQFG
jgi:hypothetical protein